MKEEKKYKRSGSFTLKKFLNLLFDAHRRAPVDLHEKILDFLDVGLLRMLFIKLKNIFWWERNNFFFC
jgi:hypothetical protein